MSQYFSLHPQQPQPRLIRQAADIIRSGGLVAFPTDSAYALGCHIGDLKAVERMRRIRGVGERHHFTLLCRDLAEISVYAQVNNAQYRLLKATTPGSYTFILKATRELPRRIQHPKRKTVGLRVPDHPLVQALLIELNEPMLSTTLILPGEEKPLTDAQEIRDQLQHVVDLVLEAGECHAEATTVIDLSGELPELIRAGCGSLAPFGLD